MPETLFCPLRKTQVMAFPEEKVRQALIQKMTQDLGYPRGSLIIEKNIDQLPHLQKGIILPKRRVDLAVFVKDLHPHHIFYPLLLIECKAIPLNFKTLRQIVGYNQFIGAYFIAAANQTNIYLGSYQAEKKDFCFQEGLLPYETLIQLVKKSYS